MSSPASVERDGSRRLFLALRLPEHALDVLSSWGDANLADGRRVGRGNLHVTLAFLGRLPAIELPAILDALRAAAAASSPHPLVVERWRETRSVGMLVLGDPEGAAGRLAEDLHGRLEAIGCYRREARAWLPHVTVLRFHRRPRLDPPLPVERTFVPSDAAAYISHLHPSGARYEVLESIALGEASDPPTH